MWVSLLCTYTCFPVLCTHSYFPVLCTLTFPHTLYTRCVSLSSVHTQVSLSPAPGPGNSCLQPSPFTLAACFTAPPKLCLNGDPWQALLQEPTVPRASIPRPAPDRLRRGAFKTSHWPSLQSLFSKKPDFFSPKCRGGHLPAPLPADSVRRKSVVQHA